MNFKGDYEMRSMAVRFPSQPDVTKSTKELNFTPKSKLERRAQKTVDWYNAYFDAGKTVPEKSLSVNYFQQFLAFLMYKYIKRF
jgi:hypothetical protein